MNEIKLTSKVKEKASKLSDANASRKVYAEEMGVKIKEQTPNADGKTKSHTVIDYFNDTAQEFEERLMTLLAEIFSPDVPFSQTSCQKHCAYCNFRKICGRKVEKY